MIGRPEGVIRTVHSQQDVLGLDSPFNQPYRANAYFQHLQKRAPSLTLDWYRIGLGRYQVVMLYSDNKSLESGRKKLRALGVIATAK